MMREREQGRAGVKRHPRQKVYKGHRDIAVKASHHFKKSSITLKIYLKSLALKNLNFSEKDPHF
jgi:hypothetical protein